MSNPVKDTMVAALTKMAKKPASSYTSDTTRVVKGILIDRDPPITTGWCGNDECEHTTHKERRAAQKAADTRAKK